MMQKVQIVILAAGNGTRMKNVVPKVLIPVKGKPMLQRLVEVSIESGLTQKPVVVVNERNEEQIKAVLGDSCFYALQTEQLGTGHAISCAKELLEGKAESILVLNGDHPFVSKETLHALYHLFSESKGVFTMATTKAEAFSGWQSTLYDFGRIIRDEQGSIIEIVEKKDATLEQLEITEVNPAYYCFDANWLWQELPLIQNDNNQKEYYLTQIVKLAIKDKKNISDVQINPEEALGVNSPEQLLLAEELALAKNFNVRQEAIDTTS